MSSKMKSADTDTKISLSDEKKTDKIGSNVIECSLNMNVSLPRGNKRSKIFQRAQSFLILLLTITLAIVYFKVHKEIKALDIQVKTLMLKYEQLSKNVNRIQYRVSSLEHRLIRNGTRHRHAVWQNDSNSGEAEKVRANGENFLPSDSMYEEKKLEKSLPSFFEKDNKIDDAASFEDKISERERYERAIVAFEKRNQETTTLATPRDDSSDDTWNDSRTGRYRRDEGRGKKRRKVKRRLKRSRRRLAPLVATFVGAVPEQHVTDAVYVGPWVKSSRNESKYAFNKFHLVEDKTSIEVTTNGLYMISAQIYYFGEPAHYSYWILLNSEGDSSTRKVIKCATTSASTASEASCFTSFILPLRRGDRLRIQQQERDRLINLREGHSYVQIMLLSGESPKRRVS